MSERKKQKPRVSSSGRPMTTPSTQAGARTSCKLCPETVYAWQEASWLRKPLGLSHTECIERAVKEGRVIEA